MKYHSISQEIMFENEPEKNSTVSVTDLCSFSKVMGAKMSFWYHHHGIIVMASQKQMKI